MTKKPEGFDEHFIDRKIVQADLGTTAIARAEITDPLMIEAKIRRAKAIFSSFLYQRTTHRQKSAATFSMDFDSMRRTLELSDIPYPIAKLEIDKIILSVPGLIKTETGYTVSDPKLIFENFGSGSIKKKVLNFLLKEQNKSYSYEEIAGELGVSKMAVGYVVNELLSQGQVVFVGKKVSKKTQRNIMYFKIAKNK
jgi:biotin operon repressor